MRLIYFIVISSLLLPWKMGADIIGSGIASSQLEAKKEALADLAGNIKSEVRSHFEIHSNDKGSFSSGDIKISVNLPILGADVSFLKRKGFVESEAVLSVIKVKKLYIHKLKTLNLEIETIADTVSKTDDSLSQLEMYENLYSLLNEYSRYESVAIILDISLPIRAKINKAKVKIEIDKLKSNIDTIELATSVLASEFSKYKKVFVYAPLLENYTTVSEFASVFQKIFKAQINTTKNLINAKYILVGEYVTSNENMVLNYDLLDRQTNEVLESKTITINKKAYTQLVTKPKNPDFDALLNTGVINSHELKVSLKSNKGSESLLFRANEDIELFVKLNKMGYYFIVGYTQTKKSELAYLLELHESGGDEKFKMFVNADDVNHWISLGKFSAEAPFGIESLQIIASNKKISILPQTTYDKQSGYYVISKEMEEVVTHTRGLKKKKSHNLEMSEDVLSFTTIQ